MSKLGAIVDAVEKHRGFVIKQVERARADKRFAREVTDRWNRVRAEIPISKAPTGLALPRLALPEIDEPGEIARYLFGDGLPGEFPYLNGAYREMYLEPLREIESFQKNGEAVMAGASRARKNKEGPARPPPHEEPTRLFFGLMIAGGTDKRFHFF